MSFVSRSLHAPLNCLHLYSWGGGGGGGGREGGRGGREGGRGF